MTTDIVTLVVNEIRNSASPATWNREQFFREQRVAQRLVKELLFGIARAPLMEDVSEMLDRRDMNRANLQLRCPDGAVSRPYFLADCPSVSVICRWSSVVIVIRYVNLHLCRGRCNEGRCR